MDTAQHVDAFFVIRAISSLENCGRPNSFEIVRPNSLIKLQ